MKKLISIFYFFILMMGVISCNGQENKNSTTSNIEKANNKIIPDLFDKKYFHGYQLSPDSDHPIYTYTGKDIGDLTVNFINKNVEKQIEWLGFDFKNGVESSDNPDDKYFDDLDEIIKKKLDPSLKDYEIIAEHIPAKFIDKKNLDYIYPYTKTYYLYNKEKKDWQFLKEKNVSDGSNEKNITKLSELNSMINLNQKDKSEPQSNNISIPIEKIDGVWSSDCSSENYMSLSSTITNAQFTVIDRFSMNAQLKKIDVNKYKFYFTDFPPIIHLPEEMQNWDNLDDKKAVGLMEIIDDSKINIEWFGFYYKKGKKYIQTENPFNNKNRIANLIKCSDK
ncbi:RNA-binding protein [Epilithonimonas caeni]|uniref:hypothetical protein n=1 Tax=Epilithonimonas caeni TaxID=365343 RepID=UPI000487EB4F|nr:hypothetical protein [Epilithonimonas caeni]